jgi:hypothetical protein
VSDVVVYFEDMGRESRDLSGEDLEIQADTDSQPVEVAIACDRAGVTEGCA